MVTHPCINRAHDCLTSVAKHKTFAPCYMSPHCVTISPIDAMKLFAFPTQGTQHCCYPAKWVENPALQTNLEP